MNTMMKKTRTLNHQIQNRDLLHPDLKKKTKMKTDNSTKLKMQKIQAIEVTSKTSKTNNQITQVISQTKTLII